MLDELDDETLVAQARRGVPQAYRALYERHRPVVARLVEAFSRFDADEVNDVVQDSFVRAFDALDRLREAKQFRPWLLAIARNRCLSRHHESRTRDHAHQAMARLDPDPTFDPPAVTALAIEQEKHIVRELIDAMSEGSEKETARLFYLEGELSVREIAERQGETKSAVGMRLERFRARFKLKLLARLSPEGE